MSQNEKLSVIAELKLLLKTETIGLKGVKVGGPYDGGYVLPQDFDGIVAVFSPGVGTNSSFESYFASLGIPCFLADPTVDGPAQSNKMFSFSKIKIGSSSKLGDSMSLGQWIESTQPNEMRAHSLIIQCDIEGDEWVALNTNNFPREIRKLVRYLIVEFHNLHEIAHNSQSKQMLETLLELRKDFAPIFKSANNYEISHKIDGYWIPPVLEVTFINRIYAEGIATPAKKTRAHRNRFRGKDRNNPFLPRVKSSI